MPNRGTINRRTGKTTPRRKVKTHWGAGRSQASAKPVASKKAAP